MRDLPVPGDFQAFLDLFKGESDRAVVVLGGAYLDARLEETLRTWLADDVDLDQHFRAPSGVLSSYGAKYNVAHALGALPDDLRETIKHVGAIRNHFAHHVLDAKWDHPLVQKHMDALRRAWMRPPNFDRDIYLFTILGLSGFLKACEQDSMRQMKAARAKAMELQTRERGQ